MHNGEAAISIKCAPVGRRRGDFYFGDSNAGGILVLNQYLAGHRLRVTALKVEPSAPARLMIMVNGGCSELSLNPGK